MYTVIKGKWLWNEYINDEIGVGDFQTQCLFVSNGQTFDDLAFSYNAYWDYFSLVYHLQGTHENVEAAASDQDGDTLRFGEQEYRTIDFGTEGCSILLDAYDFILANAQPVYGIAEKLQYIAENTQRVYDKGYQEGNDDGYDEGLEIGYENGYSEGESKGYEDGKQDGKTEGYNQGKVEGLEEGYNNGYQEGLVSGEGYSQAESDFWDTLQNKGARVNYQYAFSRWTGNYFRPKYKIVPTEKGGAKNIFHYFRAAKKLEAKYIDLSQVPRGDNEAQSLAYSFCSSGELEEIEDIGLAPSYSYAYAFAYNVYLKKVAMIRVDVNTFLDELFKTCRELEEAYFEGEIGRSFSISDCTKLKRASIESIINHLSDNVSGKTLTLSKIAVDNAFVWYGGHTDENGEWVEDSYAGTEKGGGNEWYPLADSKPNWTITLV